DERIGYYLRELQAVGELKQQAEAEVERLVDADIERLERLRADTRSLDALADDATRMILAMVDWSGVGGVPDPEIRQAIVNIVHMACEAALARVQGELHAIDQVMARRPALDKPTRWENVQHAIAMAAKADEAQRRLSRAEADLARVEGERDDHAQQLEVLR